MRAEDFRPRVTTCLHFDSCVCVYHNLARPLSEHCWLNGTARMSGRCNCIFSGSTKNSSTDGWKEGWEKLELAANICTKLGGHLHPGSFLDKWTPFGRGSHILRNTNPFIRAGTKRQPFKCGQVSDLFVPRRPSGVCMSRAKRLVACQMANISRSFKSPHFLLEHLSRQGHVRRWLYPVVSCLRKNLYGHLGVWSQPFGFSAPLARVN